MLNMAIHNMPPILVSPASRKCDLAPAQVGRRHCLKAFLSATGVLIADTMITNCAIAAISGPGILRIKVSSLASLIPAGGSVMVTYDAGATLLLINHAGAGRFHVLNPTCTHAGCTVGLYAPANRGISCPCHGSFFDISGQVLNGPADRPLASYPSSFDSDDTLSVTVPGLQLYINNVQMDSDTSAGPRLKLSFPTHSFARYGIHRASNLTDPPQATTFSDTATGTANQTTLLGSGKTMSVWVDVIGSRGFFTLSLQLFEVS
jgi:cytochrome b6-f complex iron-sulfur subunit